MKPISIDDVIKRNKAKGVKVIRWKREDFEIIERWCKVQGCKEEDGGYMYLGVKHKERV